MTEACLNLSTDMAVAMAKKFLRTMAQPFEHSQLGVSLWDENEIQKREQQAKHDGERKAAFGADKREGVVTNLTNGNRPVPMEIIE